LDGLKIGLFSILLVEIS